jgi:hypothetical protein
MFFFWHSSSCPLLAIPIFPSLAPVGHFSPVYVWVLNAFEEGGRTILLDMSRPGGRGCRSRW